MYNRLRNRLESNLNSADYISLNIPLLMRVLEYAHEDANDDLDLHFIVERMIDLSANKEVLTMSDYTSIVDKLHYQK